MRKSAELRRAEIIGIVLKLADRIGPDRVTTGAVATEVGVTQAALFRHFPTKSAMWQAVAEHVVDRLTAAWNAAIVGRDSPVERLTSLFAAQLEQIAISPALPMLLFSRELNVENTALREAFHGRLTTLQSLLSREFAAGQRLGIFRADVAARDVALLVTALIQSVAIRWSLGARDFELRNEGLRLLRVQLRLLTALEK